MLDMKDSIGFEWRKSTRNRFKVYHFKCKNCDNIVKSRKHFFKKHTGNCISCSSKLTIKIAINSTKIRPYEAKYNIFKSKCPETNLKYEDYLEFTKTPDCHYCGRILPWQPYGENNPGFWLDRMNNNLGHIKGNLVTCCGICNKTKRDEFTYEEFLLIGYVLRQIRLKRELT